MPQFRKQTPQRTCTKLYKSYRSYKKALTVDFYNRCGYCDGHDNWSGGYRSYHIDHFAPKKKFPSLITTYSNLIYACASCNGAKLNKWPSNDPARNIVRGKGFLNPVIDDFNSHFARDRKGRISGRTPIARNMMETLNLGLERHSVLWTLSKLSKTIDRYTLQIDQEGNARKRAKLNNVKDQLLSVYYTFTRRLQALNNA